MRDACFIWVGLHPFEWSQRRTDARARFFGFAADADPDGLADLIAWGLFSTGGKADLRGIRGLRIKDAGHGRIDVGLLESDARIRLEGIPEVATRTEADT